MPAPFIHRAARTADEADPSVIPQHPCQEQLGLLWEGPAKSSYLPSCVHAGAMAINGLATHQSRHAGWWVQLRTPSLGLALQGCLAEGLRNRFGYIDEDLALIAPYISHTAVSTTTRKPYTHSQQVGHTAEATSFVAVSPPPGKRLDCR